MSSLVLDLSSTDEHSLQRGLAQLAIQVRQQRPVAPAGDGLASLFEAELRLGLQAADAGRAYDAAAALRRRTGDVARCHRVVARVLGALGQEWAEGTGTGSIAAEHRVTASAAAVVARLRAGTPAPTGPRVVLAAPPGDRHLLALESLAHLLEDAGHLVDVVGDLPAGELAAVARGAAAVVLSAHVPYAGLPVLLAAVRRAAPEALLVLGGPGATAVPQADLVTSEVPVLLEALAGTHNPLSDREREVLRCVADGLTNAEAAAVLGISPATLKTHLDRIFDKTRSSGRAAAVAVGLRRGWIA